MCYTEKAPNAWQRRGTQKTRNTYNQPKETECDENTICPSGTCCCRAQQYGQFNSWRCCDQGSECDKKEMKCKGKSRNVLPGGGDGGEVQLKGYGKSMHKPFEVGRELDINAIQQQ